MPPEHGTHGDGEGEGVRRRVGEGVRRRIGEGVGDGLEDTNDEHFPVNVPGEALKRMFVTEK